MLNEWLILIILMNYRFFPKVTYKLMYIMIIASAINLVVYDKKNWKKIIRPILDAVMKQGVLRIF